MRSRLTKIIALPVLLLGLSSAAWATPSLVDLGAIGVGTSVVSGEITPADFVGLDWYTETGFEDEGFFYFDVYDFTVSGNMKLTITVDLDPAGSDLLPLIYLYRPGNAPDLLTQPSIWTRFDDTVTEIDFYEEQSLFNPTAPLLDLDDGGAPAEIVRKVTTANPDYRFIVTGDYFRTTTGDFWGDPAGTGDQGAYTITFNGVPEPSTWLLLGLGLLALLVLRNQAGAAALAPVPIRRRSGVSEPRR
jgi:hypothetical protein